MLQLFSGLLT